MILAMQDTSISPELEEFLDFLKSIYLKIFITVEKKEILIF